MPTTARAGSLVQENIEVSVVVLRAMLGDCEPLDEAAEPMPTGQHAWPRVAVTAEQEERS